MRIGVDLDGTLAHYTGYAGPNTIGPLLPGAREWLEAMVKAQHTLIIFTARGNDPEGVAATLKWIETEKLGHLIAGVTGEKLYSFDLFLDDRAVRFEGAYPEVAVIEATRPWWTAHK